MLKEFPTTVLVPGIERQVLSESPVLMVVSFKFTEAGLEYTKHDHPHVQSTFVRTGRFRFTVGHKAFVADPGKSFVVPPNVMHGCICLKAGELIDTFTPRREEFLRKGSPSDHQF